MCTLVLTCSVTAFMIRPNLREAALSEAVRVQVLMRPSEAERFERYCTQRGYKKSTLIARLIRDHLDREETVRVSGRKK